MKKRVIVFGIILLLIIIGLASFVLIVKGNTPSQESDENTSNAEQASEEACHSHIDCESITNLMTPYHACSTNNGCTMNDGKCVSNCEGKNEMECRSTNHSTLSPEDVKYYGCYPSSTGSGEIVCVGDENYCLWG